MFTGRKLPLTLAFVVLIGLAFGASCKGFFVNPTLTAVNISPATPTITNGTSDNTQQFKAVGTFDDGSHKNTAVTWASTLPTTVASIDSAGLATAKGVGQTTITATSIDVPSLSGTTTLSVVQANVTSITVTPSSTTTQTDAQFSLKAVDQVGNDISGSATWIFTVHGTTTQENGMSKGTPDSTGQVFTVGVLTPTAAPVLLDAVATYPKTGGGTVTSNTVSVNVTQ